MPAVGIESSLAAFDQGSLVRKIAPTINSGTDPEKTKINLSGQTDVRSSARPIAGLLDKGILKFFREAIGVSVSRPSWFLQTARMFFAQQKAAKRRAEWRDQGVEVPPMAIVSVTRACNLKCKGCYSHALAREPKKEMGPDRLTAIINEARTLGVGTILIAGGEPLTVPGLFSMTKKFPDMTFALFTNGTMIDDRVVSTFTKQRHVVPVVSLEGDCSATDGRRGAGTAARVDSAMALLRKKGVFFGTSITLTSENFSKVLDENWITSLRDLGCRLFFFVEYVPVESDTEPLALTEEQRAVLLEKTESLRKKTGALFIAFPGDEEQFGGCLAAGRGFVHINASGDLEPCPFAPYSDRSLASGSLKSALRSPLLQKIRQSHGKLKDTTGGCALWAEREWVESLTKSGE